MNPLGLSKEALARRRKYVCASDAAKIMEGRWPEVYRDKKGLAEPDDLSNELRVQMGSFTEPFNLFWYEKQTGRKVLYFSDNPVCEDAWMRLSEHPERHVQDEFIVSQQYPFMACSLDATSTTSKGHPCVLDAKHVGQFRYDEIVARYTPAMTHQCVVVGVAHWALSVFSGNGRWDLVEQDCDPFYAESLIAKEREFWSWVERGEDPPNYSEPAPPPKPQPRLRTVAMPTFDEPNWPEFVRHNNWAVDAANAIQQFVETEKAHKAHMASRESIKEAIPADVGELRRGGFTAKRSKSNALTMTNEEKTDA